MLKHIARESITPSPTNPRRSFDEESLAELADSIREHGILQPIIVRRHGTADSFELVAGERRFRAAGIAELEELPALIRDLNDEQVAEVQLIENAAREDVTPLEEADAIIRLAETFERDVVDIAAKLGRPEAFVRRRIKLGGLVDPLRGLLENERIGVGSAELLAELPESLQLELAGDALSPEKCEQTYDYDENKWVDGDPTVWSYRAVRSAVQSTSRRLSDAPWDLDRELWTHPCTGCPKRSDAQASLLDDVGEGRCLDGDCWNMKFETWSEERVDAGDEMLTGKAASAATNTWKSTNPYEKASTSFSVPGREGTEKFGDLTEGRPRIWAVSDNGRVTELVRRADIAEALRERGDVQKAKRFEPATEADKEAEKERKRLQREQLQREQLQREREQRRVELRQIAAYGAASAWPRAWVRALVDGALLELNKDRRREVSERRELETEKLDWGGQDYISALRAHADELERDELSGLLAELLAVGPALSSGYGTVTGEDAWRRIRTAAGVEMADEEE